MQITIELNKKDIEIVACAIATKLRWAKGLRDRARSIMVARPDLYDRAVRRVCVLGSALEQIEAHLQDCNCVLPEHICGDCRDTGIEEENNG